MKVREKNTSLDKSQKRRKHDEIGNSNIKKEKSQRIKRQLDMN